MTSKMSLEQYMAERHALGFSLKTDEGCIRRFLQDFAEPDDGEISFTKEYLQLTAQMYPDIVAKLEVQFGGLIPQMEVSNESI